MKDKIILLTGKREDRVVQGQMELQFRVCVCVCVCVCKDECEQRALYDVLGLQ